MNKAECRILAEKYRSELLDRVVPFWMKHAPDYENGGYYHCLDRDGSVIDPNKSLWIEARAVWMFSRLSNTPRFADRPEREEWLSLAKLGADFLKKYGHDGNHDYYFRLSAQGEPIICTYEINSNNFAVLGFIEYFKATGNEEYLELAKAAHRRVLERRDHPKGKWTKAMPAAPRFIGLGVPMMGACVAENFNSIVPDPKLEELMRSESALVLDRFVDRKHRVIRENILEHGGFCDTTYEGRHINPGHGIETLWFLMQNAMRWNDRETIRRCHEALLWNLDFGWDAECGGLYYFMDVLGKPHLELCWDMKLWWVHLEALISTLMGYRLTGDETLLDWFLRLDEYTWKYFPDPEYGEWYPYLTREGQVNNKQKGGRWKCFFHLPRALLIISEMLESDVLVTPD